MMQQVLPMSTNERIHQILRAVDEMFRRLEAWMDEPNGQPIMPRSVEAGIAVANDVCCSGEIPKHMRDLVEVAVPRLWKEFEDYNNRESFQPNGSPGPKFWAAAKAAKQARFGAEAPLIAVREPIKNLRASGVSDWQIATAIYGFRGEGPFVLPDGTPDVELLNREADNPGSVWLKGFIPPWERRAHDAKKSELAKQLERYDALADGGKQYEDPATVEELLRDGAFIQQIERVKHVSRREILQIAEEIGIEPKDAPGYVPEYLQGDDGDDATDADGEPEFAIPANSASKSTLRDAAIKLYVDSDRTLAASEITKQLRKLGHDATTQSVAAVLTHWKRANAETAATAETAAPV